MWRGIRVLLLSCIAMASLVCADEHSHKVSAFVFLTVLLQSTYTGCALIACPVRAQYKDGEPVRLWVNKVGPYDNPQETYNYYYLPFCAPRDAGKPKHKWGGLGEVLQGNELIDSQLEVKFKSEFRCCCSIADGGTEADPYIACIIGHFKSVQ